MAFGLNFFNTPAEIKKLPIQEPQQIAGINQLFEQGLKNANPDIQEEYSRRQFAKRLPGIAERINSMGGGQQRSQAANYELGGLQSDFESNLAGQRYQAGLRQLQLGLTPQNEYLYQPEQPGLGQELAQKTVGALAENLPSLAYKAGQLGFNKLFGGEGTKPVAQQIGQTATNTALDALGNPKPVTPTTNIIQATTPEQALAPTAQAAQSQVGTALQQAGQGAATAATGTALGKLGAAGLGTVGTIAAASWWPTAIALGVPAAITLAGFGAVKGYELWESWRREKAEALKNKKRNA